MYGKKKKAMKISTEIKKVSFDKFVPFRRIDDGDKGTLYAQDSRNCNCLDGAMRRGVGIKVYTNSDGKSVKYPISEEEVDSFFFTHKHSEDGTYTPMLCCVAKNGDYYFTYWDSTDFIRNTDVQVGEVFDKASFLDAAKDGYMLLFGAGGVTAAQVERTSHSGMAEDVQCGCVWNDRAYAVIDPHTLLYSAPLEPLDFSNSIHDSGRIYLPRDTGNAVAIKPLGGKLYLFSDYGITEIEPAGSAMDFRQAPVSYSGGQIVRGSVWECNGKLYFFALDGVYAFDGKRAEKKFIQLHLQGADATKKCGFATYNGGFFLRFCDKDNVWQTYYLDPEKDSGYRTMNFCALSGADGRAFFGWNKMPYYIMENGGYPSGEKAFFTSEMLDFSTTKPKILNSLKIVGSGRVSVYVYRGDKVNRFIVNLSNGSATVFPKLYGKEFQLQVVLENGGMVSGITAEAACF